VTTPGGNASNTWSNGFDRIGAYDPAQLPDRLALPDSIGDVLLTIMNPDALTIDAPTSGGKAYPGSFRSRRSPGTGPAR